MTALPPAAQTQDGWPDPGRPRTDGEVRLAGLVVLALQAVPPAGVLPRLRALLAEELGALDVRLRLTDHQLQALRLVTGAAPTDEDPEPLGDSVPGRVFLTQRPATARLDGRGVTAIVPVTLRGQRLGVLVAVLPDRAGAAPSGPGGRPDGAVEGVPAETLGALAAAADALGPVLIEVSRGSDVFEVRRRSARFTVAAEMQLQLQPGRAVSTPGYTLAGQVEPAPYVQGDAFDWSADDDALTVCAVHVTGRGQSAALLSTLAVTALRNARRAELALADQASLADQAVYAQHGGDQHASALLLRIPPDGAAQVVDAGSPVLLLQRDGAAERVVLDAQLPLGMFDDTPYVAQDLRLLPGDRLLVATPGALEATSPDGRVFGEQGLLEQLALTAPLPPQEVARRVISALVAHQGEELASDATVLCLDWRGA